MKKKIMNNKTNLHNNVLEQSCRMLKQKFKGIIKPTIWHASPDRWKNQCHGNSGRKRGIEKSKRSGGYNDSLSDNNEETLTEYAVWFNCPDKWKSAGRASAGRKGAFATNRNRLFAANNLANSTTTEEPLSEYEQQYVQVHEAKIKYKEQIEKLIDYYLNLTKEEKIHITARTPQGSDYQKTLIEKARDNMLRFAKRLNDAEQSSTNYNEILRIKNILKIGTPFLWSIHCIHLFTILEDI